MRHPSMEMKIPSNLSFRAPARNLLVDVKSRFLVVALLGMTGLIDSRGSAAKDRLATRPLLTSLYSTNQVSLATGVRISGPSPT
jgi:hypothetical protein